MWKEILCDIKGGKVEKKKKKTIMCKWLQIYCVNIMKVWKILQFIRQRTAAIVSLDGHNEIKLFICKRLYETKHFAFL